MKAVRGRCHPTDEARAVVPAHDDRRRAPFALSASSASYRLTALPPSRLHSPRDQRPDILVVRFSSIGDILLTTPCCAPSAPEHPGARITVLTKGSTSRCSATIRTSARYSGRRPGRRPAIAARIRASATAICSTCMAACAAARSGGSRPGPGRLYASAGWRGRCSSGPSATCTATPAGPGALLRGGGGAGSGARRRPARVLHLGRGGLRAAERLADRSSAASGRRRHCAWRGPRHQALAARSTGSSWWRRIRDTGADVAILGGADDVAVATAIAARRRRGQRRRAWPATRACRRPAR